MENNTNTTTAQSLTDSPETLTKNAIIAFLRERGAQGIMDAFAISTVLGTIQARTVRYYANKGELKALNPKERWQIYTIEALADFLMRHPKFAVQTARKWELDESIVPDIKAIINTTWKALLQHFSEDELVSEVYTRLMTSKTPLTQKQDIKVLIRRKLCDIWRTIRRDAMGHTVNYDITNEGDNKDE